MAIIRMFEQGHEDFSSMGHGVIQPLSCSVREEQGGAYELDIEMAMDEATQYDLLVNGCVLQVPVPAITTPLIRTLNVTVTEYWKTIRSGKLYSQKSDVLGDGNRVLQTVKAYQKVTVLNKSDATWWRVTTKQGKTGYFKSEKLSFFEQYNTAPGDEIQERQIRDQLFRIYRTEKDTEALRVRAWARHIYYDLMGVALKGCKLAPLGVTAALYAINAAAHPSGHGFDFLTNSVKVLKKGDYTHRSMADAHLNPDDGVLAVGNLRMIRDNYDVFFLDKSTVRRNTITYGQNLKGVTIDVNDDGIVNRILPVGKKADGSILYKNLVNPYVSSPRNTASTKIQCKAIEYDVEVGEEYTVSQAEQKLVALAQAEFENGIDLPSISVTVDFLQLGDTQEYAQFKELDRLYLSDIVRVVDTVHGVDLEAEVTEYDFDCLAGRYTKIGIGVTSAKRTLGSVGSFMLPNGTVSGTKLALGSVNGSRIEDLSVKSAQIGLAAIQTAHIEDAAITSAKIGEAQIDTAHIKEAAIGALTAGAVTAVEGEFQKITAGMLTSGSIFAGIVDAVKARIGTLLAENLTADELYAHIATIAVAQITSANIESANITWADVVSLTAAIAGIAQAEIGTADIDWAHVKDLATETAIITQGVGGDLYIARLAVTEANMVSLTTGELVVKGEDGAFYSISVDSGGQIVTTLKQVMNDDLSDVILDEDDNIIYGGITAGKLNVQNIFAENAVIASLIAANISVDTLFSREATINQINAIDIRGNTYLQLALGEKASITLLENSITTAVSNIEETVDTLIGHRIEIVSTSDILSEAVSATTLSARVWHGSQDVTNTLPTSRFQWRRVSADPTADTLWNAAHTGIKSITLTTLDVQYSATYYCDLTDA